jgi:diamine N-acetyltransferase
MHQYQKNNIKVHFGLFEMKDLDNLILFLENLSTESKKRFGPHPFTKETILELFNLDDYLLFTAKTQAEKTIIAYTVVKKGWLDFEHQRLNSYGLNMRPGDFTIAPSVADNWQGMGIGSTFLEYVIHFLSKNLQMKRLILWGGVQRDNERAVRLYQKQGFRVLGHFEYHGLNTDMIFEME